MIARWLPAALDDPGDLTARYLLHYASATAGMAFDNAMLHFTHALEHPLSAMRPEIAHGLGLSALLPSVLKTVYPRAPEVLAAIYEPIVPGLRGTPSEADKIAAEVESWLFEMGITEKLGDLGFTENDVTKLEGLVYETPLLPVLVSLAPVPENEQRSAVRSIYEDSFRRHN
jgi:alcohol dehydrogenase class IV